MARIDIDGLGIEYELLGHAGSPAVAITPGGRFSKNAAGVPELGRALADQGVRVLLWDRPNCGASDLRFAGAGEGSMHAATLLELIAALNLGPTALVAGSAGARVSLLAARQNPGAISKMVLWWISGGLISMMRLGSYYCCEPAEVAVLQGMAAVAEMPIWAEQVAANPRNREAMLAQDPAEFVACMERWAAGFIPQDGTPVRGISRPEFAQMTMPTLILRGSPRDIYHPAWVCEQVDELLPNSRLVDPPWPPDIFAERMADGSGVFSDWPLLAPEIADFLRG